MHFWSRKTSLRPCLSANTSDSPVFQIIFFDHLVAPSLQFFLRAIFIIRDATMAALWLAVGDVVYTDSWWKPNAKQLVHGIDSHIAVVTKIEESSGKPTMPARSKRGGGERSALPGHPTPAAGSTTAASEKQVTLQYFYRPYQTFHKASRAFHEQVSCYRCCAPHEADRNLGADDIEKHSIDLPGSSACRKRTR
jgi:hypothetical protein